MVSKITHDYSSQRERVFTLWLIDKGKSLHITQGVNEGRVSRLLRNDSGRVL